MENQIFMRYDPDPENRLFCKDKKINVSNKKYVSMLNFKHNWQILNISACKAYIA